MNVKFAMRSLTIAAVVALPLGLFSIPAKAAEPVVIQIGIAPPALPVYVQPYCPGDDYIWTPGYWAYDDVGGYFWVPGTWVLAPEPGYLWTPAWWGWEGGFYHFHAGYWGSHVGFYGGINYGFGYFGDGFYGGEWRGGHFFYNSAYNRFGTRFHPTNVFVRNINVSNHSTVSFNGHGGIDRRPNAQEEAAMHERHVDPTSSQRSHESFAGQNHSQFFNANHGHPGVTAANTPESFHNNPNRNPGAPHRPTTPGTPGTPGNNNTHPGQPGAGNNNHGNNSSQPGAGNNNHGNNPGQPSHPVQPGQTPHPTPQPQPTHPTPQPQPSHPQPQPRPTPQPQPTHPQPQPRPTPQPQPSHPQPQPRPQPMPSHQPPTQHEEHKH